MGNLKIAQIRENKVEKKKLDQKKKELKARAKTQEEDARRVRAIREGFKKVKETTK